VAKEWQDGRSGISVLLKNLATIFLIPPKVPSGFIVAFYFIARGFLYDPPNISTYIVSSLFEAAYGNLKREAFSDRLTAM